MPIRFFEEFRESPRWKWIFPVSALGGVAIMELMGPSGNGDNLLTHLCIYIAGASTCVSIGKLLDDILPPHSTNQVKSSLEQQSFEL